MKRGRAGGRINGTVEAVDDNNETVEAIDPNEQAKDEILTAFAGRAPSDRWIVRVYRIVDEAKPYEYLFAVAPSEIATIEDRLQADFGTGLYCARAINGTRIFKQMRYSIYVRPRPQQSDAMNDLGGVALILKQQAEMFREAMQRLEQRAVVPAPVQSSAAQLAELLSVMKGLREIEAPPRPAIGADEILKIWQSGFDMAKAASGSGGETNIWDTISSLAGPALEAISKLQTMVPQQPPPIVSRTVPMQSPSQQQVAAQPSGVPAMNDPAFPAWVTSQLALFTERARRNADPEVWAAAIAEEWPEQLLGPLLATPDPVEALVAGYPPAGPYRAWFGRLIAILKDGMADDAGEQIGDSEPAREPSSDSSA